MRKPSALLSLVLILHNVAFVLAGCLPRDCIDLKCHGLSSAVDGPHTIYPNTENLTTLQVSCDQTKNDGGWIVFQRRSEEGRPVRFDGRSWHDYKHGFGDHGNETTELWLGNGNMIELLYMDLGVKWELLIEAYAQSGSLCRFAASGFSLDNETNENAMKFAGGSATGCQLRYFNGIRYKPFRTNDHRGTSAGKEVCFNTYLAGWWYSISGRGNCQEVFLNGPHQPRDNNTDDSMYVKSFDEGKPLKGSVMLIRAMDATSRICNNPCVNKPNSVCTYVADPKRNRCICPLSMCGRDCKETCKDGSHCEYDATNDVNECKCPVGFDGPLCTAGGTTRSEPQSALLISLLVLGLLAAVLAAGAMYYFTLFKRRRKEKEEYEEESRKLIDAAVGAPGEEDGIFELFGW